MINPKVYIIVLNWNGVKDTLACLSSLEKIDYPYYEIVVVDNGSTDGSAETIKKEFPDVKLIEVGKNVGYALGNNIGIKYALNKFAEFILILNNDTLVDPHFLSRLMQKATQEKSFSVFSPQIRLYPAKDYLWSAGGKMILPFGAVKLNGRNKKLSKFKQPGAEKITFAAGAALLVKAEVFKKVGGFDGKFFLYWEETDWEARAQREGFSIMYVPESIIYHKVGRSSGGETNPKMQYYFFRNNLLFARKNLKIWMWLPFLLYFLLRVFVYEFLRAVVDFAILKPARLLGWFYILRGIFDFCRNHFGKL